MYHIPYRRLYPISSASMWFDGHVEPTDVFCHNFETDVCTVHSSMGPLSFQHTEKRLLRIVQSEMNILHNICMFSFFLLSFLLFSFFLFSFFHLFFFFMRVCAWFGVDDSLGLHSLGEAITHLNKNDEPPSWNPLSSSYCLMSPAAPLRNYFFIRKFTNEFFIVKNSQILELYYYLFIKTTVSVISNCARGQFLKLTKDQLNLRIH